MRHGERPALGRTPAREQKSREGEHQEHDDACRTRRRAQGRESERHPNAEKSRPHEAAHAPKRVHAAHHAPLQKLLDAHGMDIDRDIDNSHGRAEQKKRRHSKNDIVHPGKSHKKRRKDERIDSDHAAAAEMPGQDSCKRHRHQ